MVWPNCSGGDYPFACKKCLDENIHQEHESDLIRVDGFLLQLYKFIQDNDRNEHRVDLNKKYQISKLLKYYQNLERELTLIINKLDDVNKYSLSTSSQLKQGLLEELKNILVQCDQTNEDGLQRMREIFENILKKFIQVKNRVIVFKDFEECKEGFEVLDKKAEKFQNLNIGQSFLVGNLQQFLSDEKRSHERVYAQIKEQFEDELTENIRQKFQSTIVHLKEQINKQEETQE
jgi:hypothetical protein